MEKFFNIHCKIKSDSPPFERDFYGIVKSSFFHFPSWKNGRTKLNTLLPHSKEKKEIKEKGKRDHSMQPHTWYKDLHTFQLSLLMLWKLPLFKNPQFWQVQSMTYGKLYKAHANHYERQSNKKKVAATHIIQRFTYFSFVTFDALNEFRQLVPVTSLRKWEFISICKLYRFVYFFSHCISGTCNDWDVKTKINFFFFFC